MTSALPSTHSLWRRQQKTLVPSPGDQEAPGVRQRGLPYQALSLHLEMLGPLGQVMAPRPEEEIAHENTANADPCCFLPSPQKRRAAVTSPAPFRQSVSLSHWATQFKARAPGLGGWIATPTIPPSGFPGGSVSNKSACKKNRVDTGAWQDTAHGVARLRHDLAIKPPPTPPSCFRGRERQKSSKTGQHSQPPTHKGEESSSPRRGPGQLNIRDQLLFLGREIQRLLPRSARIFCFPSMRKWNQILAAADDSASLPSSHAMTPPGRVLTTFICSSFLHSSACTWLSTCSVPGLR